CARHPGFSYKDYW
nr:immunoglobulin heavy chain junction region [Macaca mulatta]MOY19429.1 immunoglobulin heavy chain junction region [Macaca mulatta]